MLGKKLGKSEQPWPLALYKKRDPNRGADPKQQAKQLLYHSKE